MLAQYKKQARNDIGNGAGVYVIGMVLAYAAAGNVPPMVWLGIGMQVFGTWWVGQGYVAFGRGKGVRLIMIYGRWFLILSTLLTKE